MLLTGRGLMADQACEINTKATQVQARSKINTEATRTKRHSRHTADDRYNESNGLSNGSNAGELGWLQ